VQERSLHWDDHRISNERLVELCPFLVERAPRPAVGL
jgi:hypothetical protein